MYACLDKCIIVLCHIYTNTNLVSIYSHTKPFPSHPICYLEYYHHTSNVLFRILSPYIQCVIQKTITTHPMCYSEYRHHTSNLLFQILSPHIQGVMQNETMVCNASLMTIK